MSNMKLMLTVDCKRSNVLTQLLILEQTLDNSTRTYPFHLNTSSRNYHEKLPLKKNIRGLQFKLSQRLNAIFIVNRTMIF